MEPAATPYTLETYKQVPNENQIKHYTFFSGLKCRIIILIIISIIEIGIFSGVFFGTGGWRDTFIPLIVFPVFLLLEIFFFISIPYCFRVTVDRFNRTISFGHKSLVPCMCDDTSRAFRMDEISNFTLNSFGTYRPTCFVYLNYKNGNPSEMILSSRGSNPSYNSLNDAVNQFNMILKGEI